MSAVKYEIGQQVWWASFESIEAFITCPDCGGGGHIRCILFDETELFVECEGCRSGYNPPTGQIQLYERTPHAVLVAITGFEVSADKIEYRTNNSYIVPADDLFDTEAEAFTRAEDKARDADVAERERVNRKEKPTHTWAWHVTYHRRCIREAEKAIVYHTSKLNVARAKAKEQVI